MKRYVILFAMLIGCSKPMLSQNPLISFDMPPNNSNTFFSASHPLIQYTGRMDMRNRSLPRAWSPGVYMTLRFTGSNLTAVINDQELWNKNHNYLQIIVDDKMQRIQTRSKNNHISISNLADTVHTLIICKNTESNIGYIEFAGVYCNALLPASPAPKRKIEFIGNSITCGTGSDVSDVPCGKGLWQDQHNAYMAYGPLTARALQAQWHLSAVSGIGLVHSCCNMNIIMPPVFDKIDMRGDSLQWDFNLFQPDVVTVCLGQNDGVQNDTIFCKAYIDFIQQLRNHYPHAQIVLLTSPMANEALKVVLKKQIRTVVKQLHKMGDKKISYYFFSRSFNSGCDYHPDLAEHRIIAKELTTYLKKRMRW